MADQNFDDNDDLDTIIDRGDSFIPNEDEDEEVDDSLEEEEGDTDDSEEEEEEEEIIPKPKEPRIPKHRLDEVLSQRDEARDRQLWLEEQLEKLIALQTKKEEVIVKPSYDFSSAEEKYISLIIEGETAQASKLRTEIDKERKAEMMNLIESIKTESESKVKVESTKAVEIERFNSLVETFKTKHTFLDEDSDDYNEEAVDTINTLTAGYISSGKTRSESLRLAVNKVVPMYNKEDTGYKPSKSLLGKQRAQEAVKKAASASNKQPPQNNSTKSSGKSIDPSKIDVTKMSERDFNNLTEREKRILRGD
jgi:hypothetical protein